METAKFLLINAESQKILMSFPNYKIHIFHLVLKLLMKCSTLYEAATEECFSYIIIPAYWSNYQPVVPITHNLGGAFFQDTEWKLRTVYFF